MFFIDLRATTPASVGYSLCHEKAKIYSHLIGIENGPHRQVKHHSGYPSQDCWNFLHAETCMQGNFYNTNLEISLNVWWLILLLQDYTTVSTIEIGMKNCSA